MITTLNNLKTYLTNNLGTYLTTLEIKANSICTIFDYEPETDTKQFSIILQYDQEYFEDKETTAFNYDVIQDIEVVFYIRKIKNALTKTVECRNAFIELVKQDCTFGNLFNYVELISSTIGEDGNLISSSDTALLTMKIKIYSEL